MALARWKDLCLDTGDLAVAADFWAPVLGLETQHRDAAVTCLRGDPPERTTWLNKVPEPKTVKNRVHLDLVRDSVHDLLAAGAVALHEPAEDRPWHVLADPQGNELCVFPPKPGEPTALVTDAQDATPLAGWWAGVLGAELSPAPDGTMRWLRDVDGLPYDVWKLVAVPEAKTVKNRWHWDVVCDDVDALVARGATVLRSPDDDVDWDVLTDPEGNEFCVFTSG
jgi:catechol 2,3-dioxygenase-like lactoylglutathione lyase family enzyme